MRWASTVSADEDLERAVAKAASSLRGELDGRDVDLLLAFVSHHHHDRYADLPALLRRALPHRHLLGCSASGVIGNGHEIEGGAALSLTAASLPGVELQPLRARLADLPDADASPRAWSGMLGIEPEPPPVFLLLVDPFSLPAPQLLSGLDYAYPPSPKAGGLASGAVRPGENALYLDDEVARDGAVGLALRGDLRVRVLVAQGCRPIGKPLRVTRGRDNVVTELEGRPALQVVQELAADLSERDRELARQSLFLGFETDRLGGADRPEFLIRNIVGLDPASGSMAIGDLVRGGQLVQFHVRDATASAEDLDQHLDRLVTATGDDPPRGGLLFSCVGRGAGLYGRPGHDSDSLRAHLGDVPLGGFFCNGEIGPVGGTTFLHGYTSVFALFWPRR